VTGSVRLSLSAAAATLLTVAGLQPIVVTGTWLVPATVAVLLVAGVGTGLRTAHVPAWAVVATQGVVSLLWVGYLVAQEEARLGFLPSRAWANELADTVTLGVASVREYQAPVPLDDGILLLLVAGVALTALSVDALAVTARVAPLAGVPLAIMHSVAMATSPQGASAWAFVAAAGGYLLLLSVDGRDRAARWGRPLGASASSAVAAGSRASSVSSIGLPLGMGALAVAVAGATVLPQGGLALVPGRDSGGGSGGQTIRTENPIVDLKRDLVRPDNVDVIRFTTEVPAPEYLRLLTLDVYDGEVWRTSDRPVPERNRVADGLPSPPGLGSDVARSEVRYQLEITPNLQSQWLPLPYPAAQVATADGDWRYDASTLDVVATDRTTEGLRYDVTSLEVAPTPGQLSGPPPAPGRLVDMLTLPGDTPPVVRELAREVTADADDNYARAVALQQWFRTDGGFVYDLSVDPGNGSNDLVAFLDERRGYCEQYAATMAIMARALGIPARVAVGYLRGQEPQPGFWVVRAQDAHAWPELYFEGVGWVRFEPTPAARTGAPPSYTVPDAEQTEVPESLGTSVDTDDSDPGAVAPLDDLVQEDALTSSRPSTLPLVAVVASLLLVSVTPVLAGWVVRRRRWLRAADDPSRLAEAAWADIQDAALEMGYTTNPSDTVRVSATALSESAGLSGEPRERLEAVARATERARYGGRPPQAGSVAESDAVVVRQALVAGTSRGTRWRAKLWPAPMRRLVGRRQAAGQGRRRTERP
jgi:transglutaminase-like putative cysteine protease